KVLDRVLTGYDVRLRPNFGGDPVPVGISIYISSIEQISEINMDYTITMFFHQTWKDPRLAYHETNLNLTLDYRMLNKLWVPDCYFLNSTDTFAHDVTVEKRVFQLQPDGTVRYGIRLTTTAACSLDLQKFPLDKQACKLEIESYGYTVEDVILFWEDDGNAIHGTEDLHVPQFSFLGKTITSTEVYFYTGSYMRLILRFEVQREVSSFLVQVYWPTVLTTVLSWMSFWMNCDSAAARVTVGLTSMLILTTISSHVRNKLPQVPCVKAIDIYIIVCFFFVFFSLMEYVYINYLFYSRGPRHHHRRRRRARRVISRFRYCNGCTTPHSRGDLSVFSLEGDQASGESLSQLSSTSAQALLFYGIMSEIRKRAEARERAEAGGRGDLEENASLDESHGHSQGLSSKLFSPDYVPKVDRWSRVLFPLAFGLFNIAYWAYHIN
uniref:Gamma-aminobutyric acid receptor subunit beta n=1 Tax=Loxodonta africana TaxID=9785 RepID=G3SSR0_LOXAF